ncbi:MAG TPA: CinA family nicotinamide mononucleotide deamidase-related protein [Spirochaetia bacterium]|nr:CinA family nicotinamide mononucleotide deamidase-related protein [Spirochaetia bacterium]
MQRRVTQNITAAVLSVGTELTEGSIQDTHARFIAETLRPLGITVRTMVQIPDDREIFRSELRRLAAMARILCITGGLGPTSDDLTREIVAEMANTELTFHVDLWQELLKRFSGRPVSETNRKQAFIPEGFGVIPNPYGTAPGFWGRIDGTLVFALPGPPRELHPLVEEFVVPMLRKEQSIPELQELRATAFLVSESRLEELLQLRRTGDVSWGTRAEQHRIVFTLRGGSREEREVLYSAIVEELGELRIHRDEVNAAQLLLDGLADRKWMIAAAESCTGGIFGALLTDIPGASESFWGSMVVYSNEAKQEVAHVSPDIIDSHGAVSRETVAALVRGTLDVSHADVAVSISGVAGPGGGTREKPVGTVWIGVGGRDGRSYEYRFPFYGSREMIRRRSAVAAVLMCLGFIEERVVDSSTLWQYI